MFSGNERQLMLMHSDSATCEILVGDFVSVTDRYMWRDGGYFKNTIWVLEREPVQVRLIIGRNIVIERDDVLYGPVPLSCIDLVWRPVFTSNATVELQEDVENVAKGAKGKVHSHVCIKTGSNEESVIMCYYSVDFTLSGDFSGAYRYDLAEGCLQAS